MVRSFSLLLAVLVSLVGCRETVTGPAPITPAEPRNPTTATYERLYLKGPQELRVGQVAGYRAEPIGDPRLDHYAWGYYGPGDLEAVAVDPEGRDRVIEARATEAGTLVLFVRAYDADGNSFASGNKEVTIAP